MHPLVSVFLVTYNHEKHIRSCLEGIMRQKTNFSFEVIIGEDCSTDNTKAIIKEFEGRYPDIIKPLYHEKNVGGMRNAYEFCYPKLKGKYIALCEGDDYWIDPYKLQKQVDFLEQNSQYVVCFHRINTLYEHNGDIKTQVEENKILRYSQNEIFHIHIPSCSAVFRRCIESFPKEFFKVTYADIFLFGLLSRYGGAADLGFIGGVYRKHSQGVYTQKKQIEQFRETISTRKVMYSCSFFNQEQKQELKKEIMRKKVIYIKNFLKKKQLSNCLKIVFA